MKYTIGEITISARARSETSPQSRLKISDEARLAINLPRATGWPPRLPAPQTLARTGQSRVPPSPLGFGANGPSAPLRHLRRPPTPSPSEVTPVDLAPHARPARFPMWPHDPEPQKPSGHHHIGLAPQKLGGRYFLKPDLRVKEEAFLA